MPQNESESLGMPDSEFLELPSINWHKTNDPDYRRQTNEKMKQINSKPINSTNNNLHTNNRSNQYIDYLLQGQAWKLTEEVNAEIT